MSHIHTIITIIHSLYHSHSTKCHPHSFISSLEDKCTILCSISHSSCKALLYKDKLEGELSTPNDSLDNSSKWNQLICFSGYFLICNPLIVLEIKQSKRSSLACLRLHKMCRTQPKSPKCLHMSWYHLVHLRQWQSFIVVLPLVWKFFTKFRSVHHTIKKMKDRWGDTLRHTCI